MLARLFLLTVILFCLELGLFLLVLPWTSPWEYNYFLQRFPGVATWLLNFFLRGAISGLGLIDIGLALGAAARFPQLLEQWFEPAPAGPVLSAAESLDRGPAA